MSVIKAEHRRYNYVYEKVFVYIFIGVVGTNYDGVW